MVNVVIVNYRTPVLLTDCLRSLEQELKGSPETRVTVVDNHSKDDSVKRIREAIATNRWSWASVIPAEHNGGFAFGNNIAIRRLLEAARAPDHICLLNPDTLVRPGAIAAMSAFLRDNPRAGIVGSLLEFPNGQPQISAHPFPCPIGELSRGARLGVLDRLLPRFVDRPLNLHKPTRHDWVSGAAMMIRRQVFADIGLFDEGFFLYYEEVDFCRRASAAGWETWVVPSSRVMHLEGAATGIHQSSKRRSRYWYDSRRRYFVRHFGLIGLAVADLLWAAGRASLGVRRLLHLGGRCDKDPKSFSRDLLLGDLKAAFGGRLRGVSRA